MVSDWLGEGLAAVAAALVVSVIAVVILLDGNSKTNSRERVQMQIVNKCFNQPDRKVCADQLTASVNKIK